MITLIIGALHRIIGIVLTRIFIVVCSKRYTMTVLGILFVGIAYKHIATIGLSESLAELFSVIEGVVKTVGF
jgi:hypothetical protein